MPNSLILERFCYSHRVDMFPIVLNKSYDPNGEIQYDFYKSMEGGL